MASTVTEKDVSIVNVYDIIPDNVFFIDVEAFFESDMCSNRIIHDQHFPSQVAARGFDSRTWGL